MLELKRGESARETIAQAIEYLTWIEALSTDDILAIFAHYRPDIDLAEAFFERFGCHLPAMLNESQVITIVAATVDPKTEGSVQALKRRGFPITLFGFRYYQDLGAIEFLPHPQDDQDAEVVPATTRSREQEPSRRASAGELARLHVSIDRLETRLEEFRPSLEALRRPTFAARTYGPVSDTPPPRGCKQEEPGERGLMGKRVNTTAPGTTPTSTGSSATTAKAYDIGVLSVQRTRGGEANA